MSNRVAYQVKYVHKSKHRYRIGRKWTVIRDQIVYIPDPFTTCTVHHKVNFLNSWFKYKVVFSPRPIAVP